MDINFDKLAIAIIDEFESDREYSAEMKLLREWSMYLINILQNMIEKLLIKCL